jgi:hypothetical protein
MPPCAANRLDKAEFNDLFDGYGETISGDTSTIVA